VYVADTPLLTAAAYSTLYPEVSEAALVCHMGENACTVTGALCSCGEHELMCCAFAVRKRGHYLQKVW